jgi:hypothetical protein
MQGKLMTIRGLNVEDWKRFQQSVNKNNLQSNPANPLFEEEAVLECHHLTVQGFVCLWYTNSEM